MHSRISPRQSYCSTAGTRRLKPRGSIRVVRDVQIVEEELSEISGIQDDLTKFERIIAWSAAHPDEVVFAVRYLSGRSQGLEKWIEQHSREPRHPDASQAET
jgi:hypothetical protein